MLSCGQLRQLHQKEARGAEGSARGGSASGPMGAGGRRNKQQAEWGEALSMLGWRMQACGYGRSGAVRHTTHKETSAGCKWMVGGLGGGPCWLLGLSP